MFKIIYFLHWWHLNVIVSDKRAVVAARCVYCRNAHTDIDIARHMTNNAGFYYVMQAFSTPDRHYTCWFMEVWVTEVPFSRFRFFTALSSSCSVSSCLSLSSQPFHPLSLPLRLHRIFTSLLPYLSLSIHFKGFIGMGNICLHCQSKWNR